MSKPIDILDCTNQFFKFNVKKHDDSYIMNLSTTTNTNTDLIVVDNVYTIFEYIEKYNINSLIKIDNTFYNKIEKFEDEDFIKIQNNYATNGWSFYTNLLFKSIYDQDINNDIKSIVFDFSKEKLILYGNDVNMILPLYDQKITDVFDINRFKKCLISEHKMLKDDNLKKASITLRDNINNINTLDSTSIFYIGCSVTTISHVFNVSSYKIFKEFNKKLKYK